MVGTGSFSLSLPPYFIPVIGCCKKLARVSSIHSSFCLKKNCIIDLDLELLNFRRRRIIFPKKYSRKYQYIWYIFSFLLSVALIVTDRIVAQLFLIGDDDGFLPQKTDYFKPPLSISIDFYQFNRLGELAVVTREKKKKRNYRAERKPKAVTTFSNYKSNLNGAYHERGRWPSSRERGLLINAIGIYYY